jgi:hypothetical protein
MEGYKKIISASKGMDRYKKIISVMSYVMLATDKQM